MKYILFFLLISFHVSGQVSFDTIKPDIDFVDDLIPEKIAFGKSISLPIDTIKSEALAGGAFTEATPLVMPIHTTNSWDALGRDYDCEPWTNYTEWKDENKGDRFCLHQWVYAEWSDVNKVSNIVLAVVAPPCGFDSHDNEARICSACHLHQTRVKHSGAKEIPRKSEYKRLLEKSKN